MGRAEGKWGKRLEDEGGGKIAVAMKNTFRKEEREEIKLIIELW